MNDGDTDADAIRKSETVTLRSKRIKIIKDADLKEINVDDLILTEHSINYVVSWKDIIFLPFMNYIVYIFFVVNFISIHLYLYHLGYHPKWTSLHILIVYSIEIFYILHTLLIIFHKIMALHRTKKYYQPVCVGLLILDVLSLLPVRLIFRLYQRFNWDKSGENRNIDNFNASLRLLRIVRIIAFYLNIRDDPCYNQKLVLIFTHFIASSLLTQIIATIFYTLSCYNCPKDNWSNIMKNYDFNSKSTLEWFVTTYTLIQSLQQHNAISSFTLQTMKEHILACLVMYLGFAFHYMYLYGSLITEYMCEMRFKLTFENRLQYIKNYVEVVQMPQELVKTIVTYYKLIWNTRKGLIEKPPAFYLFPQSIQVEITTDIYWDAISHSQVFSTFQNSFKRELSMVMRSVTYVEGQFIYQKHKIKSCMIYLVSGIVEVISEESDRASVLSFSSGTILGEIDCIMPSVSKGNFRCATDCEVQILEYYRLWQLLLNYSELTMDLLNQVEDRIQYAKYKKVLRNFTDEGDEMSHIFWIKDQWRKIIKATNNPAKHSAPTNSQKYSSKYLNLMVLSSSDELKVHSICIRGRCSFVMDANSSFRIFLHYIFLASVVIQMLLTTYQVAFEGTIQTAYYPLTTLLDIIYILDIYIQCITAGMVHNVLVTKPSEVFILRSRQFSFIVDLIASIPFDMIGYFLGHIDAGMLGLLRMPKLLKVYKILTFFQEKERKLTTHVIAVQIMKFTSIHFIIITLVINLEHIIVCGTHGCDETEWIFNAPEKNLVNVHFLMVYNTFNIYFGDLIQSIRMTNVLDMITMSVVLLLGFYVVNFCYVQISATSALKQMDARNHNIYLELLETFINRRPEVKSVAPLILNFAKLQWELCKGLTSEDLIYLMDQKSMYLRTIIRRKYVLKHLKKNEFFSWLTDEILDILAEKVRFYLIPPGQTIVPEKKHSYQMYIVVKGYCEVVSVMPGDFEKNRSIYRTSHFTFPILAIIHQVPTFLKVTAVTTTFCMSLPSVQFLEVIKKFPTEYQIYKTAVDEHMEANYTMLNRVHTRVNKRAMFMSLGKVEMFEYKINESVDPLSSKIDKPSTVFSAWHKKCSNFLHRTYDPNGSGYEIYETIRTCVVLINALLPFLEFDKQIATCVYDGACVLFYYMLMLAGILDLFIRMHLHYYNDIGIKVTDVKMTCRNYLKRSFAVDLFSMFPFYTFKIHMLFGRKNHMHMIRILLLISRPFQLYRPYFLCMHKLTKMTARKAFIMKNVINAGLILYMIATYGAIRLVLTCHISNQYDIECSKDSWISRMQMKAGETWIEWQMFMVSMYTILSIGNYNANSVYTTKDYVCLFVIVLVMNVSVLVYIVNITGHCIFDDTKLVEHQNLIKNYLRFIRNKSISFKTKAEMLDHVANVWRKSKGESPSVIFKSFPPYLKQKIFSLLWKNTLMKTTLFSDQDESLFRVIAPLLEEFHFKKDAHVIRCNDVQSNIYIVSKGHIRITIAGIDMHTLSAGGIFGCLTKKHIARQTINATAVVHTRLLCIKSSEFFEIVQSAPILRIRLNKIEALCREYVEEHWKDGTEKSFDSVPMLNDQTKMSRIFLQTAIHGHNVYFLIFDYLTSVHISSISSILTLFLMVFLQNDIFLNFWIFMDIYYTIFMYFKSIVSYTDAESGILITKLRVILKRYFKSFNFTIWLITTLPFYLVYEFVYKGQRRPYFFLFNKVFRILFLIDYYLSFLERGNVPKHIQLFFLMYLPIFMIHATFIFWWRIKYSDVKNMTLASVYLHIINVFTTSGLEDLEPVGFWLTMGNMIVVLVGHCLHIYLMVAFSKMLLTHSFNIQNFKISVEHFKSYCTKQQISQPIISKSMEYLMYLYREKNGEQIPQLLNCAPAYIRQDHMMSLYGEHFERHAIFSLTHVDFLRQLLMHLHSHVYLPGNLIVETGDRNGRLYFIEEGYIAQIEQSKDKLSCMILRKQQSFGEIPGLSRKGYEKTFRALTISVVLSIKRSEWEYLLDWFPASREIIHKCIEDMQDMFH